MGSIAYPIQVSSFAPPLDTSYCYTSSPFIGQISGAFRQYSGTWRGDALGIAPPYVLRQDLGAVPGGMCMKQVDDPTEQESDKMERFSNGVFLGNSAAESVQLVSLGASCGPKLSFKDIGRGAETLPFDWSRTKVEGLLRFISTDFTGFYEARSPISYSDEKGQKWNAFRSPIHSFWHDDPTSPAMRERYNRRIERFLSIDARTKPVLFVRSVAATSELPRTFELLQLLMQKFGPHAKLLIIIDFQGYQALGPCQVVGTNNNLLLWSHNTVESTAPYGEIVKKALDWAAGLPITAQQFPNLQAVPVVPTDWGLYGAARVPAFV